MNRLKTLRVFLLLSAAGVAVVLLLSLIRKNQLEIEGDIETNFVGLAGNASNEGLAGEKIEFSEIPLKRIECRSECNIHSPDIGKGLNVRNSEIEINASPSSTKTGGIFLKNYDTEKDVPEILLSSSKRKGKIIVFPQNNSFTMGLEIEGNLHLKAGTIDTIFEVGKSWIEISGASPRSYVSLESADSSFIVAEDIPVGKLIFSKQLNFMQRPKLVSGLLGGKIWLTSLGGRQVDFRKNELLQIGKFSGLIYGISFKSNRFSVEFAGNGEGVEAGTELFPKKLSPSLLQFLLANRPFLVVLGGIVYAVGLAWKIMKDLNAMERKGG